MINKKFMSFAPCALIVMSAHVHAETPAAHNRVIVGPSVIDAAPRANPIQVDSAAKTSNAVGRNQEEAKISLRSVTLEGVTAFDSRALIEYIGFTNGQKYNFSELELFSEKITQYYRDRGYLVTRAILPQQDLSAGELRITVFEGHLSKSDPLQTQNAKGTPEDARLIDEVLRTALCPQTSCGQQALKKADVERAVALITDVTGSQVLRTYLEPGQEIGSTRLNVASTSRAPYQLEVGADNFGSQATGQTRVQTRLALNDVRATGDQLGVSYLDTDKSNLKYYGLDYSFAMGVEGWRAGLSAGRTYYSLPENNVSGDASVKTVYASYPVTRTEGATSDFVAAYDHAQLSQNAAGANNRRLQTVRVGLSGSFRDKWLDSAQANNEWSIYASAMNLEHEDLLTNTGATEGARHKLAWRYSRVQYLGDQGWFAGVNTYGQFANNNLDPFAKLALGGANAVRAYAPGEAAGDQATVAQLSAGKTWIASLNRHDYNVSLAAFYDQGWSHLQIKPTATGNNSTRRSGHGLEFQLIRKDTMNLRLFWARASNGNSTTDDKQSRIGVTVGFAF